MPIEELQFKTVKHKGCPEGYRNIAFVKPDGSDQGAVVQVHPDWDMSLFCDRDIFCFFVVGTSADKTEAHIERWLSRHVPNKMRFADLATQQAALNGKGADSATHLELVTEAMSELTKDDTPTSVPPRGLDVVPLAAFPIDPKERAKAKLGYEFRELNPGTKEDPQAVPTISCWGIGIAPRHSLHTKATAPQLLAAFRHADYRDAYFLFGLGGDYFLEALESWGSGYRRREATSAQASLSGLSHEDVVKTMVPILAKG